MDEGSGGDDDESSMGSEVLRSAKHAHNAKEEQQTTGICCRAHSISQAWAKLRQTEEYSQALLTERI